MILLIGRPYQKNKKGFTFIELLLVIIILGIILGLSLPLFRRTFTGLQQENLTQSIAQLMRYAQETAVVERSKYRINFDFKQGKYWLTAEKEPLKFQKIAGRLGKVYSAPQGICLEGEKDTFTFYADGRTEQGSIYISDQNRTSYILTARGRIGDIEIQKSP